MTKKYKKNRQTYQAQIKIRRNHYTPMELGVDNTKADITPTVGKNGER